LTSSIHALILYSWNEHHKVSWNYQDFTHHIFSNQIGQLSLTSTAPELRVGRVGSCSVVGKLAISKAQA